MNSKLKVSLQVVAVLLVVIVIAGVALPVFTGPGPGTATRNLSNAKQLATACRLFAMDHRGRFPMHLSELEPDYIPQGGFDALRCSVMGRDKEPKLVMDWIYLGAGFDDTNPPPLLIASPQATTTLKEQKRVIVVRDFSGGVVKEAEYQQLLSETIRQMQARK